MLGYVPGHFALIFLCRNGGGIKLENAFSKMSKIRIVITGCFAKWARSHSNFIYLLFTTVVVNVIFGTQQLKCIVFA